MSPRETVAIEGRCACGAVLMGVKGPVLSMFLCACRDCQRATGTGHSSAALVPVDALSVAGEVRGFDVTSASGAVFTRHFCPACGTPLFGMSSRAPGLRMLAVGFFTGSNDWFAPARVIFARSASHWDALGDLPRHETYPEKE